MIRAILKKYHLEGTIVDKIYTKTIVSLKDKWNEKGTRVNIHTYGIEALDKIYKVFKANDVSIWFEYGTLLGAYREHGFIPYDYDIDLGMYAEQFTPELERALFNEGFRILHFFYKVNNQNSSDRVRTEITLTYKDIHIDIFFYFVDGVNRIGYVYNEKLGKEMSDRNMMGVIVTTLPNALVKEIDFLGIKFAIPSNAAECLEKLYGKTFMTPIKDASYTKKVAILPYEEAYGEIIGV